MARLSVILLARCAIPLIPVSVRAQAEGKIMFTQHDDGAWQVNGPGYIAEVNTGDS